MENLMTIKWNKGKNSFLFPPTKDIMNAKLASHV